MPINPTDYHPDWPAISRRIRFNRALGVCEGSPRYPECRAVNEQPHPITGSKVMLTVAHLDHDLANNNEDNLRALCQRCHLAHDLKHHMANAAATRRQKRIDAGQLELALW